MLFKRCTLTSRALAPPSRLLSFPRRPPPDLPLPLLHPAQYAEANKGATQLTVGKDSRKNFPIEDFVAKNKLELVSRSRARRRETSSAIKC